MAIISDFNVEKALKQVTDDLKDTSAELYIESGYDSFRGSVYFTYIAISGTNIHTKLLTLVYNEALKKWVTKLSYSPYKVFNINEDWYSFNILSTDTNGIWRHNSNIVPFCNFYGDQHEFMLEFVLNINPEIQKMVNDLLIVSNEVYPIKALYLLPTKTNYETKDVEEVSFEELLTPRYQEVTEPFNIPPSGNTIFFPPNTTIAVGDHLIIDGVDKYLVTDVVYGPIFSNVFVSYLDPNTNTLIPNFTKVYPPDVSMSIYYGIIRQNIIYKEDHFYIQVGYSNSGDANYSRPRDKYIKIRLTYKGDQQVFIQSIKSTFTYSFS